MNYKPRMPKTKVYSIFNDVDFTNDHMLKLLTNKLAKETRAKLDNMPKETNKSLN